MKFSEFNQDPRAAASHLVQKTILQAGLPVVRIAEDLGKSEDLIYKWANAQATEQNISLYAAVKLMALTEEFCLLQEVAGMFGFALIPLNGDPVAAFKALAEALEKAGK